MFAISRLLPRKVLPMFKECPTCQHKWETREELLNDPTLRLVGYQVNYVDLEAGLFLFNHDIDECGTSLAIDAGEFTDMHKGEIFEDHTKETVSNCPGYCDERRFLGPCSEKCECSYVRDVLDKVKEWPKDKPA